MNTAIIVAAGSGTRFGAERRKQFVEILGQPLIIYTLQKFQNCDSVDEIILVLPAEEIENFKQIVPKYKLKKLVKIVSGGKTRAESVWNGLNSIDAKSAEIVAVHDGARPLVTVEEIAKTIEKAQQTGAACLAGLVTDTIKEISNGKIVRTIDRTKLRRALTPQCFRYEILKRAFAENEIDAIATDECFLVEKLGIEVSIVEGNAQNVKVTTPEDIAIVKNFLKQSQT